MKLVRDLGVVRLQDKLAAFVLICEVLYFLTATVIITGLGIAFAQDAESSYGLLGTGSLPLLVVGAFAIWSLALLHVLPPSSYAKPRALDQDGTEVEVYDLPAPRRVWAKERSLSPRGITRIGFYGVTLAHVVYAVILLSHGRWLFALAMLMLGLLLLGCSLSSSWRRPPALVPSVVLGELNRNQRAY